MTTRILLVLLPGDNDDDQWKTNPKNDAFVSPFEKVSPSVSIALTFSEFGLLYFLFFRTSGLMVNKTLASGYSFRRCCKKAQRRPVPACSTG